MATRERGGRVCTDTYLLPCRQTDVFRNETAVIQSCPYPYPMYQLNFIDKSSRPGIWRSYNKHSPEKCMVTPYIDPPSPYRCHNSSFTQSTISPFPHQPSPLKKTNNVTNPLLPLHLHLNIPLHPLLHHPLRMRLSRPIPPLLPHHLPRAHPRLLQLHRRRIWLPTRAIPIPHFSIRRRSSTVSARDLWGRCRCEDGILGEFWGVGGLSYWEVAGGDVFGVVDEGRTGEEVGWGAVWETEGFGGGFCEVG